MRVTSESENTGPATLTRVLLAGLLIVSLGNPDAEAKTPHSRRPKPVVVFPVGVSPPVPPSSAIRTETKPPLPDDKGGQPSDAALDIDPERVRDTLPPGADEPPTQDSPEHGQAEPAQPEEGRLQEGQLDETQPERVPSSEADRVYDKMTPPPEKRSNIRATTRNERGELVYLSPRRDAIPLFSTDPARSSPGGHVIADASTENYNALFQAEKPEPDRLHRARELALSGRRREAIDLLQEPLPDRLQAAQRAYLLGTLHEELGNVTEALPYLQEAARLQPDSADTWYNLGLTCELAGKKDQAYQAYRQAQILEPNAADIRKALERTLP